MSLLCLKDVRNTRKRFRTSQIFGGTSGGKLEEAEDFEYMVSSFIVYLNRNRSALVRELLSYNSLLSVSCKKLNLSRCAFII